MTNIFSKRSFPLDLLLANVYNSNDYEILNFILKDLTLGPLGFVKCKGVHHVLTVDRVRKRD